VVPDHGFDWAFDEFWSRRLPAPPSSMAQPSGFAGVRLRFEEAEASLEAGCAATMGEGFWQAPAARLEPREEFVSRP
jgi:hypothetical protein